MQVVVVRRPTAIEDNGWIPAAVDVVACGVCVRRKRPDSVVEMLAVVRRGVEPGRAPAKPVVVGATKYVLRVGRVDGDRRLVLREAGIVLVEPDVVACIRKLLDLVLLSQVVRLWLPIAKPCLRTFGDGAADVDVPEIDGSGRGHIGLVVSVVLRDDHDVIPVCCHGRAADKDRTRRDGGQREDKPQKSFHSLPSRCLGPPAGPKIARRL